MSVLNLKEEILHREMPIFDFENSDKDPKEIVKELKAELDNHSLGIGLSANQINLPYRVFIMNAGEDFIVCFNPQITFADETQVIMLEGCLSYPDLYVKIKRPGLVRVKYQDEDGNTHVNKWTGMTARVFQHELDHLNGIDYLSRAKPYHLQQAKNKLKSLRRRKKRLSVK